MQEFLKHILLLYLGYVWIFTSCFKNAYKHFLHKVLISTSTNASGQQILESTSKEVAYKH